MVAGHPVEDGIRKTPGELPTDLFSYDSARVRKRANGLRARLDRGQEQRSQPGTSGLVLVRRLREFELGQTVKREFSQLGELLP